MGDTYDSYRDPVTQHREPVEKSYEYDVEGLYSQIQTLAASAPSGEGILRECLILTGIILQKNIAYGDSALKPSRIFSKSDAVEQIKVRIDDKLNRFFQGEEFEGDDTLLDLAGYYILLKVAEYEAARTIS